MAYEVLHILGSFHKFYFYYKKAHNNTYKTYLQVSNSPLPSGVRRGFQCLLHMYVGESWVPELTTGEETDTTCHLFALSLLQIPGAYPWKKATKERGQRWP